MSSKGQTAFQGQEHDCYYDIDPRQNPELVSGYAVYRGYMDADQVRIDPLAGKFAAPEDRMRLFRAPDISRHASTGSSCTGRAWTEHVVDEQWDAVSPQMRATLSHKAAAAAK
ncbi:hypothetical protein SEUCBS140593_010159 [Sporothrix eucalyptigena]|uniref:Uncharacterized protein n=1 Tax=Sporothrix eucalyptigena TaxID=1812306 RepID=A0ABP0D3K0_9PEZI